MGTTTYTDAVAGSAGAITKADILGIILERLQSMGFARRVTSIDNDLRDCLYELSNDASLVLTATTVTLTAETATVSAPSGLRQIFSAAIDGGYVLDPGSIEEYEKSIENLDTLLYGDPTKMHLYDGDLYVYDPICDSADTVRIYGVLEEDDVDDIDLHERCREALTWGVMARLFAGGELDPDPTDGNFDRTLKLIDRKLPVCTTMYERARAALRRTAHREPVQIKYLDV